MMRDKGENISPKIKREDRDGLKLSYLAKQKLKSEGGDILLTKAIKHTIV